MSERLFVNQQEPDTDHESPNKEADRKVPKEKRQELKAATVRKKEVNFWVAKAAACFSEDSL